MRKLTAEALAALVAAEQGVQPPCPECRFHGSAGERAMVQRVEWGYQRGLLLSTEGVDWLERLFAHAEAGGPAAGLRPAVMYEPCGACNATGYGEPTPLLLALVELAARRAVDPSVTPDTPPR